MMITRTINPVDSTSRATQKETVKVGNDTKIVLITLRMPAGTHTIELAKFVSPITVRERRAVVVMCQSVRDAVSATSLR